MCMNRDTARGQLITAIDSVRLVPACAFLFVTFSTDSAHTKGSRVGSQRRGKKICVLDHNVSSFLGLITEVALLREHGVEQCASAILSRKVAAQVEQSVLTRLVHSHARSVLVFHDVNGRPPHACRLLHLGPEPLGVPGVRSVLYFARPTAANAALIAHQIKASHRCLTKSVCCIAGGLGFQLYCTHPRLA